MDGWMDGWMDGFISIQFPVRCDKYSSNLHSSIERELILQL